MCSACTPSDKGNGKKRDKCFPRLIECARAHSAHSAHPVGCSDMFESMYVVHWLFDSDFCAQRTLPLPIAHYSLAGETQEMIRVARVCILQLNHRYFDLQHESPISIESRAATESIISVISRHREQADTCRQVMFIHSGRVNMVGDFKSNRMASARAHRLARNRNTVNIHKQSNAWLVK